MRFLENNATGEVWEAVGVRAIVETNNPGVNWRRVKNGDMLTLLSPAARNGPSLIRFPDEIKYHYSSAPLCEDEGCDHHGTPHVCISRAHTLYEVGAADASGAVNWEHEIKLRDDFIEEQKALISDLKSRIQNEIIAHEITRDQRDVANREIAGRKRCSKELWSAMCAMRNSINEHIPMPSLESDLLQGPEDSVFCAAVADAVISFATTKEKHLDQR